MRHLIGAQDPILALLLQLLAILVATRVVVWVTRFVKQPAVVGEIIAGLLLGPSVLGAVAPGFMNDLFQPSSTMMFNSLSQLGLLLLMFQIGQEFEYATALKSRQAGLLILSFSGIALPFALGYVTAPWFLAQLPPPHPNALGFRLFFATAMSITAVPVLGRIFMELGLSHTRTATLTIASAAIDDMFGWLILSTIAAVVSSQFEVGVLLSRLSLMVIYVATMVVVVRPLLKRTIAWYMGRYGYLRHPVIALLLIVIFISSSITSGLGLHAAIGGFVVGAALHDNRAFVADWKTRVSPLVNTLFLPIFFAYTGLRTDIGSLGSARMWWLCLLVSGIAFSGKFFGAYAAARAVGEDQRGALTIGVAMNTRGMMELVVLNIGYDLGVLPRPMFTMLVIMALSSTIIATPLIRLLMGGQAREPTV